MPSQVFLSMTPEMHSFLASSSAKGVQDWVNEDAIDMDELYKLVEEHNSIGGNVVKIHELMEKSEVVERRQWTEKPLTELEMLRLKSEERAYQNSVKNLTPLRPSKSAQIGIDMQGMKFATNFGMQVIVAFIGAFLLGWYFIETFVAPDNMVAKAVAGAGCSFCTLMLESALFVVHEQKSAMIEKKKAEQLEREENGDNCRGPRGRAAAKKATERAGQGQLAAASTEAEDKKGKSKSEKKDD